MSEERKLTFMGAINEESINQWNKMIMLFSLVRTFQVVQV